MVNVSLMTDICPEPLFLITILPMHQPKLKSFIERSGHDFVPVYRRLLSDSLTPVTAFRLLDDGSPACLFESVIGGEKVGRYSFLAVSPIARFSARNGQITIEKNGSPSEPSHTQRVDDPIEAFRTWFRYTVAQDDSMPPFVGGAIGYAGYDVIRYVENLPHPPTDDRNLPDFDFSFYHTICVFDHVAKTIWVITLADLRGVQGDAALAATYQAACDRVDQTIQRLSQPSPMTPDSLDIDVDEIADDIVRVTSNFTQAEFEAAVRKCVQYIRAGDIFQVVPSQRLAVESSVDPMDVYRSLRVVNPSPFMFYLRTPECVLVGCSPEVMCRVADGIVTVRPLAGTRRRGKDPAEDRALERELLADPKERAEHVMLVDLGRNDVGRVAQFGSIELTEVMVVERYSHVMHISSEVQGKLRPELDAFDALKSALPAGTVSGAPKVRAMEVIDEIEPHRRGPYGGAVGYIDYRGNMDTCIALRTIVYQNGTYYVQAGCGVVADSDPTAEYEETMNKAKAMIAAIRWTHARTMSKK
jgi:anthranilate synthase component I